ncbi:protein translocase subunit SecD [Aliihoeflea aestuarii]|uniref:protein translocase subunit SecD n=1 Tax=Aliihoeflea aestuarii TaxID=453840 RepID=UPI00209402C0|nr:protein translocase subunit SecD [Aliihoeflea aestuarii]MCO6392675.1 protein translocase subunit SecD [Aliihoeflea aestuarii]
MKTSKWTKAFYALVILLGFAVALPDVLPHSVLDRFPSWLPHSQVNLGLDLQGGSQLTLEVDQRAMKADWVQQLAKEAGDTLAASGLKPEAITTTAEGVTARFADDAAAASGATDLAQMSEPLSGIGYRPGSATLTITQDGQGVTVSPSDAGMRSRVDQAIVQSLEIVRRRIDEVGVAESSVQRVGADRILVQLPGLQDPTRLRSLLGSTAKMSFHLVVPATAQGKAPAGASILTAADSDQTYVVEDRIAVDGSHLKDAHASFDQRTKAPIVDFRFDGTGARDFGQITSAHVGEPFAIVLDGKVLSAPVIREPIMGGAGQISGNFSVDETVTLSALLRSGSLPAPLTVIEERTVGPDLGADVIHMGIYAGVGGLAAVMAFMVLLYGSWGMIANAALLLNLILTFAALTLIGATLTLPGIAGIILGIGIAVDANVLVNERIREEAKKGVSAIAAIDRGFRQAYSTIVDANVTTIIAMVLLFYFGSGPIRGFAITMMLGIMISMFTAVTIVRLLMMERVRIGRIKTISMEPLVRLLPASTNISFMRARFFGIGVSILLSLGSIALFIYPGLNYGIDFTGGIQVEATTAAPNDLGLIRQKLDGLGLGEVGLQRVGGDNGLLIRLQPQQGGEAAQTEAVEQVRSTLVSVDPTASIGRTEVVGPKISGELAQSGIIAVVLAGLGMLAYIWWRFEWNFAIGAIATLILDTTKTVGLFALLGLDFNLTAIAALLTIIGYSVNDKVVVYDRMRENLRLNRRRSLREIIDMSINQTLSRCIFTSMTTFLAILPMTIWGGHSVSSFTIPMLFGIVVATTSSIFIAAPILLFLGDWWQHRGARQTTDLSPLPPQG